MMESYDSSRIITPFTPKISERRITLLTYTVHHAFLNISSENSVLIQTG